MHLLQRLDLPLRDILRLILPGIIGVFLVDWIPYLYVGRHILEAASATTLIGSTVVLGAIAFATDFHARLWPWKRPWAKHLEAIRDQLEVATRQSRYAQEKYGKTLYKIWMEAICEPQVRGHLHYITGLGYIFAALATFASISAIVAFPPFIVQLVSLADSAESTPDAGLVWARVLTAPIAVGTAFVFGWRGLRYLRDAIDEGLLAMSLEESQQQLRVLANAASTSAATGSRDDIANREVRRAIATVRPLEVGGLTSITTDSAAVEQFDLRDDTKTTYCHITAYFSERAAAVAVNGRRNLYNGPVQSRIESLLQESLAPMLGVGRIRLQIEATDQALESSDLGPQDEKDVQYIQLEKAIELGVLKSDGAVARVCKECDLSIVLLRNGRIVGPNPALFEALKVALKHLQPGELVYDPFAGSRLTERLVSKMGGGLRSVSDDARDEGGVRQGFDAFTHSPGERIGLVVIDPLFEDVLPYVANRLPQLDWGNALVVSGDVSDVRWNSAVRQRLDRLGTRRTLSAPAFGKQVYFYRRLA